MRPQILTRAQVRKFDRFAIEEFQIHPLVLMENAARGAVDVLCQTELRGPVVICCGPGNNGGDGLVMARHLHLREFPTRVVLFGDLEKLSQDSAANLRILKRTAVPILAVQEFDAQRLTDELAGAQWIVDALLGTGARPPVRQPLDQLIPLLNRASAQRLAVDIPSGLDCDSDFTDGPIFQADMTCTFVAQKPVMVTDTGKKYCGDIKIVDIGAPAEVFRLLD